ncbi:TetR/AcrR family transcriptional regulator [Methylopila sp. M107]|uniref:TetR/AcrR family transcriptional regulator n=1 Tax=Methylopila sp. M107 TaxID=1101190 RepID=UPI0003762688|nr:TetR/AcrR family transcriptional regulator [Methylopila sp. M107]
MKARGRPRGFDRQEALGKAMETFWALGYEGASMAELTRAMGLNSPSLYAAFGSKDALFREAAELYERKAGCALGAAIDDAPTARAAAEGFLMHSAEMLARPGQPPGCMIVLTAVGAHSAACETREALKLSRSGSKRALERRFTRAVDEGELAKGLDIAAIAAFYVTVQQGMTIQAVDGASADALASIAGAAMQSWDGLTAGGETESAA